MQIFYDLTVKPIEYLIEAIFWIMYHLFENNAGVAIIAVSITVSTLVLPLYLRADAVQEAEQKKQKAMERWLNHIRKTFSGDERYMMTTAYYKEMDYRPLHALRGILPLFLQIPFFIAGYHYLSNLPLLSGISFGPITDLGKPDGLIALGEGIRINFLPILMTCINLLSGAVYTKGFTWKQKAQIYVLALVFLVLLYQSPSGLVLYWTMNNFYSLCKNLVTKYVRYPAVFKDVLLAVTAVAFVAYVFLSGRFHRIWFGRQGRDYEQVMLYIIITGLLLLPLIRRIFGARIRKLKETVFPRRSEGMKGAGEDGERETAVITVGLSLCLLVFFGAYIPLSVISSAPAEFVNIYHYISPLHYVFTSICVYAGLFLVWGGVIRRIASPKGKETYGMVLLAFLIISLVDFMFFKADIGMISRELIFDRLPKYGKLTRVLNLLLVAGLILLAYFLWKYAKKILRSGAYILLLASLGVCAFNLFNVQNSLREVWEQEQEADADVDLTIPLSQTGHNVVLIMLDRAIGAYVPYLMDEKPELLAQYDGFTFYPNAVSYGQCTNYGSPALFGGYDYSAAAIDARDDVKLKDKQNEALTLLPRLFGDQGYQVTVWDAPYANYSFPSDLSIYDPYPYVNALHVEGRFTPTLGQGEYMALQERSFVFYSIVKTAPAMLQDEIYDNGNYMAVSPMGGNQSFLEAYEVLKHMPELTVSEENTGDTFFMMDNNTTHSPALLQLPDYTPAERVDNGDANVWGADKELNGQVLHFDPDDLESSVAHYHSNMAALMALGDWFDKMREMGVYDNTRIIITSDHGRALRQFENLQHNGDDAEGVNAILLVKDFDATGFTTNDQFMTNAEAPVAALEGLVEDPVNPYTGNPVVSHREEGADIIWAMDSYVDGNEDTRFYPYDAHWSHVEENIFDEDCWTDLR